MILCLLVTCKVFTQTDTLTTNKPKYVFLTENQAKANIKELFAYDALILISTEQENRISGFQEQISLYENVVVKKDSIIGRKDVIIGLQDKIIKAKKPLEFHLYTGVETYNIDFTALTFYGKASIEFKRLNLGTRINYVPTQIYNDSNVYYNIILEYKIF